MRKRKMGAVLLTVTMLAGILGGCGNNSTPSSTNTDTGNTVSTSGTTEGAGDTGNASSNNGEVIELTFFNADGNQEDPWTDPVAQAITEKTGVKLKTTYPIGGNDQSEAVALMIAEQKYPDIIFAKGSANNLIEAEALIDMSDLIEQYGPNIKKLYGDEFDKLRQSAEDPSIYQLSAYTVGGEKYKDCGSAQIQWDVMKANDYKIPETLDEFETMIKEYIAASPKTEDGLDRIGITLSTADWHWMITLGNPAGAIADGAPDNGQWIVDENNQSMYKFRSEKEREYFRWLCRMYNEGILDPEFATQTHEDYIAKIASGRVVALFDKDWDYQDGEKVLKADGKLGATYCGLPLTMDKDTKCPVLMYQGLTTGTGVAISSTCADPVKAIQFIDFLCSDEGQVLNKWGIEDVNYFVDESGHRFRTDEEIEASQNDKDYQKNTGVGFHNYPFPSYGDGITDPTGSTYTTTSKSSVIGEYNEEERAAVEKWGVELLVDVFPQASEFEVPPYPPLWALAKPTEFDEIGNQLDEVAWSKLIECVIGSEADFDDSYDAMLAELEATGMSDAEAMLNEIIAEKVALTQ
ncbi:MAG: extracellular solute-binding protein [Lachnospiraceae bacterium]|nr:extracellular solute-binding protein [Lachnospiraceae bacterium]MDE7183712.1 extracellular solute-binding protein [Lachnospiraceae bacterium]